MTFYDCYIPFWEWNLNFSYRYRVEMLLDFWDSKCCHTQFRWLSERKLPLELVLHYSLPQQKPCPSNCQLSCFSLCSKSFTYRAQMRAYFVFFSVGIRFFFLIIPSTSTWLRANHLVFVTLVSNNRSSDISMRKCSSFHVSSVSKWC